MKRLRVSGSELFLHNLRARMPFRYGITTMTAVPHAILRLEVEIDGQLAVGVAADNLAPKWFTKDPATIFSQEIETFLEVIAHACRAACEAGEHASVFGWWRAVQAAQKQWATARGLPPLLWGFGVSLVERAVLDAFCRREKTTFARSVQEDALGLDLGVIYPELASRRARDFLPKDPHTQIAVRHTVGLTDPLTDEEISDLERVWDGLPQSLHACLQRHGLRYLKIKLSGQIESDRARLRSIADVVQAAGTDVAFTLDGNENYHAVAPFRELWQSLQAERGLAPFLARMIFVEQPLHRDVALTPETAEALLAWDDRPPIIIDESDGETGTLAQALASGYVGTSHKNCKGVFKGIANACLIAHRRAATGEALHMSGEDLTNVGPIALLQDLAVLSTLGIPHAERNGHHYFAGLSQFPTTTQRSILAIHGDLYTAHPTGFPILRIEAGSISIGSVVAAPFGYAGLLNCEDFTPAAAWEYASLERGTPG